MTEIKGVKLLNFDRTEMVFSEEDLELPEDDLPVMENFDQENIVGVAKNFRKKDGKIIFDAEINDEEIEYVLKEGIDLTAAPGFRENELISCSITTKHKDSELNGNINEAYNESRGRD